MNQNFLDSAGEIFDEKSFCVEVNGIRDNEVLAFAKKLCLLCKKDVFIKSYGKSEIIFIKSV